MRIISKTIAWILFVIFLFIVTNLLIGSIKYKWLSNYSDFLNQKDRNTTVSQITIKDPVSIFSLFYWEYIPKEKNNNILKKEAENNITNQKVQEDFQWDENTELNVYDPDFADDFNDFFSKTHISEEISNSLNEEWAFVIPENSEQDNLDTKTVWQQLLEKFSQ